MSTTHVLLARTLFGTSLGYHIIFATLGVGVPFMVAVAEITYALTGDDDYAIMAKRWTRGFTVALAVSITTGTTVALQLSLLWPRFMEVVGHVIGLPFLIEIFAFLLEAVFMSIYVYAADRISRPWRIFSIVLVAVGGAASALLITDVNSFMNTPRGFDWVGGRAVNIHPWQAVFNPALPTQDAHVLITAYMTVAFVTATVAAFGLLRRIRTNRDKTHQYKSLMLSLSLGGIFAILAAISGDASGKFLAKYQPIKLAVAEGLFKTTAHAPLIIGGWVDGASQRVIGGIPIPGLLSFLATDRFDGVVKGLADYPKDLWPPLYVHLLFDGMVGIGSLLILVAIAAWIIKTRRRKQEYPFPNWLLWILVTGGPLAMIAIECGWVYAEIARQPWVIYDIMRTADAVTTAPYVGIVFVLFMFLYTLITVITVLVLRAYFKRHPLSEDTDPSWPAPKRKVWLP